VRSPQKIRLSTCGSKAIRGIAGRESLHAPVEDATLVLSVKNGVMRRVRFVMGAAVAALAAGPAHADLVISGKATKNVSCVSGICTATAANAVLNASDLTNMLVTGDVAVKTGSSATNIILNAPLSWTSTSRLTLDARQSVEIDKPLSVTGTGAVTITANDGGSGGDLIFGEKGNVTFWDTTSKLVINGNKYLLVKDIDTLAAEISGKPSGFYALANDYDASVDGTYTSAPISTAFAGTFEGLGHAISNMHIESSGSAALFDSATGVLRDLSLLKVAVSGEGAVASLLVQGDDVAIIGCHATGSVTATSADSVVGGLVAGSRFGFLDGSIVRAHAEVSVHGQDGAVAGGLVGIAGFNIALSSASRGVEGGAGSIDGGLVGDLPGGSISQSFAIGKVSGGESSNVGGLAGIGGNIDNSYATGATTGTSVAVVGGLAGDSGGSGPLRSSYSTGRVKGGGAHRTSGGLLGKLTFGTNLSVDYWDIDTTGHGRKSGCGDSRCGSGAKGLRTEVFRSGLPEGFDPNIWAQKQGHQRRLSVSDREPAAALIAQHRSPRS